MNEMLLGVPAAQSERIVDWNFALSCRVRGSVGPRQLRAKGSWIGTPSVALPSVPVDTPAAQSERIVDWNMAGCVRSGAKWEPGSSSERIVDWNVHPFP